MTSSTIESMFQYKESDLFKVGSTPIEFDESATSEVYRQFSASDGPTAGGVGESSYYNGKDLNFYVTFADNYRIALYKSFVRIEGHAAVYTPGVGEGVIDADTSIPWNTYAALINTARIRFNDSNVDTEELTQNFGHCNMMKALLTHSKDALDTMKDIYFTPCIEEKRDVLGALGLSTTSSTRNTTNLRKAGTASIKYHAKNMYLADIFDSLRFPVLTRYKKLQLTLNFNEKDKIMFSASGVASNYYITDIKLYLCMYQLSPSQLIRESSRTTEGFGNFRESFWAYDAVTYPVQGSFTYKEGTVKNLQACIMAIPSTKAVDNYTGINPYQYCYGSGPTGITGVTDYEFIYNEVKSPASKLQINQINRDMNTFLYANYRQLARRINDREISVAVPFDAFSYHNVADAFDKNPYVLFCAQFYPMNDRIHKLMGGAELELNVTTGQQATFLIVKIRISCYEAKNDYTITVLR